MKHSFEMEGMEKTKFMFGSSYRNYAFSSPQREITPDSSVASTLYSSYNGRPNYYFSYNNEMEQP